jgi:hypothetical protein
MNARVHQHSEYIRAANASFHVPRSVDLMAEMLGVVADKYFDLIPPMIIRAHIWDWTRVPFSVFRKAIAGPKAGFYPNTGPKIDEWQVHILLFVAIMHNFFYRILQNEKWLRHRSSDVPWHCGLVSMDQAGIVFPGSVLTQSGRTITRPKPLPGFEVLCDARQDQITIQPTTSAFKQTFEALSQGLLTGLNWANILVAGGMVLGTLVSVVDCDPAVQSLWHSSDIDIYVYGLSADEATKKMHHIYEVFRSNLADGTPTPTLGVRNSKTITLYARYPLRRIQIVLKLAESPKDILLNFDLDICAMGWNGSELWMLPRAARALESMCLRCGM